MFRMCITSCGTFTVLWFALFRCSFSVTEAFRILTFFGAVGIPVDDLYPESVTSGYYLRAQYSLPVPPEISRLSIKPLNIHQWRRSVYFNHLANVTTTDGSQDPTRKSINSQKAEWRIKSKRFRWIIYKSIEMMLNNHSLNGHACLLRSICEYATKPFGNENGLLAEVLHIILKPSTSDNDLSNALNKDYMQAEWVGYSLKNCSAYYKECSRSPMGLISTIF